MERSELEVFIIPLVVLAILYVISIGFFHTIEGWTYLDAAYFTTATISTVGYGDITPKTDLGKMGTIPLTFVGVGLAFYLFTKLSVLREKAFDPHVRRNLDLLRSFAGTQRRMNKREIDVLKKKILARKKARPGTGESDAPQ